jgi:DNA polymerase
MEPRSWKEDMPPPGLEACDMCELAKQRSRVIWGEGNPAAPIIVVLDNPGAREDASGEPFVCGTRQTLQEAAAGAGLGEEELYVTYVLKCRPVRTYDKAAARATCFSHLQQQLVRQRPQLAICLGDVATQTFFGDETVQVKLLRGAWNEARGLPTTVTYHPLAVRRRPTLRGVFLHDWRLLAARWRELQTR